MAFLERMHKTAFAHLIDNNLETQALIVKMAKEQGIALACHRDSKAYLAECRREGPVLVQEGSDQSLIPALLVQCAAAGHWPAVVGLGVDPAVGQIVEAMKAGAVSFHVVPQTGAALQEMLDEAMADRASIHRDRAESVRAKVGLARLSRREREVLDGIAHGGSNKEIARALNISPRTVEIHRMTMMGKIGARSAADAIRLHLSACMMNWLGTLAR